MIITKNNLDVYLNGSLCLATGGGLPYEKHKEIFINIFDTKEDIKVVSLDNFDDKDILVSAYGVGDPSDIPENFEEITQVAFSKYTQLIGLNIKGIIPGEIGAEGLAFQINNSVGIPVVDSDLVGGRAAPEIQLDVFSVFNLNITPVLLVASNKNSLFLNKKYSALEIEKKSRRFFDDNGSSGILIGYPITVEKYNKYAMKNTLSLAMKVGKAFKSKEIEMILQILNARVIYSGKIKDVGLKSVGGFLIGDIYLNKAKVRVKNENIFVEFNNGRKIYSPDLFVFIDVNQDPIHNTKIDKYINKYVKLLHIPAQGYWQKTETKEMWHKIIE